uniref:Uncharacterized protein n=1 Tax=Setaria viridis TaxID=4556 RepID=A0A4V6DBA1_SETVI|nr:hypothetical protein SEVIR_2G204900v2 [Setaria viridis]
MRGTTVKALHDPSTEACTMSEFLTDTFVGNMLLVPTDKLLKSPSGLIFECRGIARAVPIKIDKIRVHLDFHIYPILNFDLLIGYPLDKLHLDKSSQGSLDKIFRNSTFTTACLENPIAKPLSKKNPLEKAYLSTRKEDGSEELHLCEAEQPSSPSIEPKACLSGPRDVVLDSGQETTWILHDEFLEKENFCAMDTSDISTPEDKTKVFKNKHECFSFNFPLDSSSHKESSESASLFATCPYEDHNHLLILISKRFIRMVVDAFVYRKHCKFRGCTMALTLQLKYQINKWR